MIIETELIKEYNAFIKANSIFKDLLLVLPDTPQSFSSFPTIIMKEVDNTESVGLTSLNRMEYGDYLTYQVDIFTKEIILDGVKYSPKKVINELRELTHKFFRNCGFRRTADLENQYIQISVKRHTLTFTCTVKNWNKSII